jgi:hypothetical protein
MVGRSPEGDGAPDFGQAWIEHIEKSCVFDGEHPGQPTVVGVVDGKSGLKACHIQGQTGESGDA